MFNSDATQAIVEGYTFAKLIDTRTNTPVELDIPLTDRDGFFPGGFAWTADDRLAVLGSIGDEVQQAFLCTPATGACEKLGTYYLWSSSVENSARGQFVYHDEGD